MKFDSNRAWKEASALVSANRDVLIALAGVFFLLPSLAVGLFLPQPQPAPGTPPEALMLMMRDYYLHGLPFFLVILLLQALGTITMLTLFTDATRPTVKESLRLGLVGLIPYVLAQMLVGFAFGVFAGVLGGLAGLLGSIAALIVVIAALVVLLVWVGVKVSLTAPVIAVEHARGAITALRRSWQLTEGNSLRIALFYVLIIVAFGVIATVTMAILGLILALIAPPGVAQVIAGFVSATLTTAFLVYVVAINAAIHRQLAGRSPEVEARPFN